MTQAHLLLDGEGLTVPAQLCGCGLLSMTLTSLSPAWPTQRQHGRDSLASHVSMGPGNKDGL